MTCPVCMDKRQVLAAAAPNLAWANFFHLSPCPRCEQGIPAIDFKKVN